MKKLAIILAFIAALLALFILYDTPTGPPAASPSYWHYLDEIHPHEDTAHYIPYEGGQHEKRP